MCGVNGIIKFNNERVLEKDIDMMNKKIIHRGPDDQGVYIDNNIGLGHVRLAVLDLSKQGHQPMLYRHRNRKAVITNRISNLSSSNIFPSPFRPSLFIHRHVAQRLDYFLLFLVQHMHL